MTQNDKKPQQPAEPLEFKINFHSSHYEQMKRALNGLFIPHTVEVKGDFLASVVIFLHSDELHNLFYLGKQFSDEVLNPKNK